MLNLNILGLDSATPSETAGSDSFTQVRTPAVPLDWHGVREAKVEIQHEKGWHRQAAYMYALGGKAGTIKNIALELGVSEQQVSLVTRQTWFRERVAQIMHEVHGANEIAEILKAGALEAVMVIRDIAATASSEKVKLDAAKDLLDRHRGKATNFVHHTSGAVSEQPDEEIKRLEEALKITN